MAELNEHQLEKIRKSISSFDSIFASLSKRINLSSLENELKECVNNYNNYVNECEKALRISQTVINNALQGNGYLFRTEGFNDTINKKLSQADNEVSKFFDDYNKTIEKIFSELGSISDADSILSSRDYSGDFDYVSSDIDDSDNFVLTASPLTFSEVKESDNFDEKTETKESQKTQEVKSIVLADSLSDIFTEEELKNVSAESVQKEEPIKKVVITKKTPLDTIEIRQLFLSRNGVYALNLEQLNHAINIVGNDVDKHAILREALKIKFSDDIQKFDYFYLNAVLQYLIKFYNEDENFTESLSVVCALFYLASSGYRNSHSHARAKTIIEKTYIDPRMESKHLLKINEVLNYTNEQLEAAFKTSSFVRELERFIPRPFFSVDDSAKIMIMAYNDPYEFLNCKDLGFNYKN